MQDDIREQLIKQFPSDVVEILDQSGKPYYGCPTCKRAVTVWFTDRKSTRLNSSHRT